MVRYATTIKETWNSLSRNGLKDDEGVFGHREVILLNKILLLSIIVMTLFIPIEIYVNGFEIVPMEIVFIGLMVVSFFFQKFRFFYLARLFCFLSGNSFILIAGVMVGKGVNNHIAFIPIMLFGMMLFKNESRFGK